MRCKSRRSKERFNIKTKEDYLKYLSSNHFKLLKQDVLIKSKGNCDWCGKEIGLNWIGHHTTTRAYKRLGRERAGIDLVAVCAKCHNPQTNMTEFIKRHRFSKPDWAKINSSEKGKNDMRILKKIFKGICWTLGRIRDLILLAGAGLIIFSMLFPMEYLEFIIWFRSLLAK